jgi:hypothetical protein
MHTESIDYVGPVNAFAGLMSPQLGLMAHRRIVAGTSTRLRVCRPLDKPLIPLAGGDVEALLAGKEDDDESVDGMVDYDRLGQLDFGHDDIIKVVGPRERVG